MASDLGQKSQSIGPKAETTPHYAARLPERHDPIVNRFDRFNSG
jgi:hypothetical protein